jgi:hypothetical protein
MVMKKPFFLALAAAAVLTGCGKNSTASKAVSGVSNVVNAPMNYISTVAEVEKSSERKIDVAALTQLVQQFNAQEGRYPKDLNELVTEHYIGKLPTPPLGSKLSYDAANGEVKVVKE